MFMIECDKFGHMWSNPIPIISSDPVEFKFWCQRCGKVESRTLSDKAKRANDINMDNQLTWKDRFKQLKRVEVIKY